MTSRPALLFYCQHAVGMGHLVRSLALASALADRFRVVFLSGGRIPRRLHLPDGVEVRALPPLALGPDNRLISGDRRRSPERAQVLRRRQLLQTYEELRPAAIVIELFPFGRKKFAPELLPLLERARKSSGARPLVVCSLRDILVGRPDDASHNERAVAWANVYFDLVLVHADPRLARLEDTFSSTTPLHVPVEYTGFVAGSVPLAQPWQPTPRRAIVVSAGGGLVGGPLFHAALDAQPLLYEQEQVRMDLVAGPFLPEEQWQSIRMQAASRPGVRVHRFVPNLRELMRRSVASVSQCGYNTALDILSSHVPALVVPYADGNEDEQTRRAKRLAALGAVRVLPAQFLDGPALAREIRSLLSFRPTSVALDLSGARKSADIIIDRLRERRDRVA